MPNVIFDTSPLQYLFQLDVLDLVPQLMNQIIVPPAVVTELRAGRKLGQRLPLIEQLPWVKVEPLANPGLLLLAWDLEPGSRGAGAGNQQGRHLDRSR